MVLGLVIIIILNLYGSVDKRSFFSLFSLFNIFLSTLTMLKMRTAVACRKYKPL